jgi:hypothetical protein
MAVLYVGEMPVGLNSQAAGAVQGVPLGRDQFEPVLGVGKQEPVGFREDVRGPEYVERLDAGENDQGNAAHRSRNGGDRAVGISVAARRSTASSTITNGPTVWFVLLWVCLELTTRAPHCYPQARATDAARAAGSPHRS